MIVKRMVSALLALFLILSLGACSKSSDDDSKGESKDKNASQETPGNTEDKGADQRKQEVMERLTSDGGQWGYFYVGSSPEEASYTYYEFNEDGFFHSFTYEPSTLDGVEYVHGREGTYEITDDQIVYTYEFTGQSGTETKEDSFDYIYEDGAFVLSVPNGKLHKSNWEELTEKMRTDGFFVIDDFVLGE